MKIIRNRRQLERLFIYALEDYFEDELRATARAARKGTIYTPDKKALDRMLTQLITQGAYIGAEEGLGPLISMGLGFDAALVNEAAVSFAQEYIYTAYDVGLTNAIDAHTREIIHREVPKWLSEGDQISELTEALRETFGKKRAQTIATTEVTNAIAGGNIASWREVNRQLGTNIISGSQWTTANDENVCPVCAPLGGLVFADGETQPGSIDTQQARGITAGLGDVFVHPGGSGAADNFKGKEYYRPPAHPRCRCTLAPVVQQ
ncbi:MAG: hypothetical protein GY748_23275 [Planctomycetaceae bacterium]|nr:hypothetical protein [Planctomycetaceae bacterium]